MYYILYAIVRDAVLDGLEFPLPIEESRHGCSPSSGCNEGIAYQKFRNLLNAPYKLMICPI